MTLICSIPLLSAFFSACSPAAPLATGYVEGDFVMIAPLAQAELRELPFARGDRLQAGQIAARMERADAEIALASAEAALSQAQNQLANLEEGRRPEEIRVLEAALRTAQVRAEEADKEQARQESLRDRSVVSQVQLDLARTAAVVAHTRVAEAEAQLAVARLPARPAEIAAARAAVDQAVANRDSARWQLSRRDLPAPAPGVIFDVLRNPGELAGPAAPVLSYLPDGAVKLRLYVPELRIAALAIGDVLDVQCDGCAGAKARITYISDAPEFTPPVIYSLENRQKLVYLVEALPSEGSGLKPGQIVDVGLPE